MRRILGAALGLWLGTTGLGLAQSATDNPVVVELYTSQGCSSCPPADALLHELAPRDDVIALALHVDYWDYIGWKDVFADPAHSKRQRAYARLAGTRVYTPQMVVMGQDHLVGLRPMQLSNLIKAHGAKSPPVQLSLSLGDGKLRIDAAPVQPLDRDVVVQIVRYSPEETVDIRRGENAGRRLTYANIVTSWTPIGAWDGKTPTTIEVEAAGSEPIVVILQEEGPGPILAAARLR